MTNKIPQSLAESVERFGCRVWNLTPHTINYDDGEIAHEIPSDGVVRVDQTSISDTPVAGMTTVRTKYGRIDGLPVGIARGDILIVSTIAAAAIVDANVPIPHPNLAGLYWDSVDPAQSLDITILVPDTGPSCKRDEAGHIVSVCQFIRK